MSTQQELNPVRRFHRPLFDQLRGNARSIDEIPELIESLAALFAQGYALEDVGAMFGVTRERVRQWSNKYGIIRPFAWTPHRRWNDELRCFVPGSVAEADHKEAVKRRHDYLSSVQETFWSRVTIGEPVECWLWTGTTCDTVGNGKEKDLRGVYRGDFAHRLAYLYQNGFLPEGRVKGCQIICHSCNRGLCVNPDHLYLGTHKQNVADAIAAGNHPAARGPRKEFCKRGHQEWVKTSTNGKRYCRACNRDRYYDTHGRRRRQGA